MPFWALHSKQSAAETAHTHWHNKCQFGDDKISTAGKRLSIQPIRPDNRCRRDNATMQIVYCTARCRLPTGHMEWPLQRNHRLGAETGAWLHPTSALRDVSSRIEKQWKFKFVELLADRGQNTNTCVYISWSLKVLPRTMPPFRRPELFASLPVEQEPASIPMVCRLPPQGSGTLGGAWKPFFPPLGSEWRPVCRSPLHIVEEPRGRCRVQKRLVLLMVHRVELPGCRRWEPSWSVRDLVLARFSLVVPKPRFVATRQMDAHCPSRASVSATRRGCSSPSLSPPARGREWWSCGGPPEFAIVCRVKSPGVSTLWWDRLLPWPSGRTDLTGSSVRRKHWSWERSPRQLTCNHILHFWMEEKGWERCLDPALRKHVEKIPPTEKGQHTETELTRQVTPSTKNGHAPRSIEPRKSYSSANPHYVRTCWVFPCWIELSRRLHSCWCPSVGQRRAMHHDKLFQGRASKLSILTTLISQKVLKES